MGCWQIEKDLLRTMPSNACFASVSSIGVPRLRRVLRALAWLYPEIGYCQGTGMVSTAQKGGGAGDPVHQCHPGKPDGRWGWRWGSLWRAGAAKYVASNPEESHMVCDGSPRRVPPLIHVETQVEAPCPPAPARWLPASCCSWRRRMLSG